MNNNNKLNRPFPLFLIGLIFLLAVGCEKELTVEQPDARNIGRVIADNFNLSILNTGLNRTGLQTKLLEEGPFTVIAPSDDAFVAADYASSADLIIADPAKVATLLRYHILDGNYDFKRLPFLFNQEIRSYNGGKLFVTHWVKGPDTLLTINGALLIAKNIKASNGLIQVVDRVLQPYSFDYVLEAIASDRNLSLFCQALQRSGLDKMLEKKETYTVFAPNNAAMKSYGLSSLQAIEAADPEDLGQMLRYHILADRRFVYDYILSAGTQTQIQETMLDGNGIAVTLEPNPKIPESFNTVSLRGTGNTSQVQLTQRDVLAGNGVLHTIGAVLKITQ